MKSYLLISALVAVGLWLSVWTKPQCNTEWKTVHTIMSVALFWPVVLGASFTTRLHISECGIAGLSAGEDSDA